MSLAPVLERYEAWRTALERACEPLLGKARADLVAIQTRPEADEKIERIEELLRAKLEPLLLEAETDLEAIQQAVDRHFEQAAEEPSERDSAAQERIAQGVAPVRERLDRRVLSLTAQARAQELLPSAVSGGPARPDAGIGSAARSDAGAPPANAGASADAPPPGMRKFCMGCGGKLGPEHWAARRCAACGVAL